MILTLRDPEAWFESVASTVLELVEQRDERPDPHQVATLELGARMVGDGLFEGRGGDRDYMIARLRAHEAELRAALPPERRLCFHVREGWRPLTRLLGLPVPATPFLRVNAAGDYLDGWGG